MSSIASFPPQTTLDLLDAVVSRSPTASAIEDGGRHLNWSELRDQVRSATGALADMGIGRGDRVGIWAPNMWEWVVIGLAIHARGAAIVPINTRYKGAEATYILDTAEASALFTVDGFLGLDFASMLGPTDLPTIRMRTPEWTSFMNRGQPTDSDAQPSDVSDILFTSGTTGAPKGVETTHAQTCRAYRDWSSVVGLRDSDRYLVVAPFFHCFGYKAGWVACLITGATILPQAVFDVDAVLDRIPRDQVSMLPGPPALYQSILLKGTGEADLSSLRLAVTGAASIPVQLIRDMRTVLGFETVITGYGLTEATGIATMCRHDDDPETIATTSGRAIPGVEIRLVDAEGVEVPRGQPGHVTVKGYNVMLGYLNRPEDTAQAIVDGWLHTGDIGVMDERGYLAITDRLKDMFICGGFNAYPAEIEHALLDHPDIAAVAVIGIPDARLGEVGMAWVVATGDIDEEDLIAWSRERLANFKVPRRVRVISELPRNASGKVLKYKLREMAHA